MSRTRSEPSYCRAKAAHMRQLAEQAQPGVARITYLLLEASWLRLAAADDDAADKKKAPDQTAKR